MHLKIPNAETIKVEDLWYEVTTYINDTFLIGTCTIYNHTEGSVKHFTDTVQAIRNITNISCKKIIRIRTNSALKFVHEIGRKFRHDFACEFTNSCANITFLKKGYGEKYQYH